MLCIILHMDKSQTWQQQRLQKRKHTWCENGLSYYTTLATTFAGGRANKCIICPPHRSELTEATLIIWINQSCFSHTKKKATLRFYSYTMSNSIQQHARSLSSNSSGTRFLGYHLPSHTVQTNTIQLVFKLNQNYTVVFQYYLFIYHKQKRAVFITNRTDFNLKN